MVYRPNAAGYRLHVALVFMFLNIFYFPFTLEKHFVHSGGVEFGISSLGFIFSFYSLSGCEIFPFLHK